MMRVLFFNIAYMDYYKGNYENIDEPRHGGRYVEINHDAHEDMNFYPYQSEDGELCLGFFETKRTNKETPNQLRIERLPGVQATDDDVDNVLVIWCAKLEGRGTVVVGWYKNATVYRYYEQTELEGENGETQHQFFNARARAEDCVLLPSPSRYRAIWGVPRGQTSRYGFGQANVWFADEEESQDFVRRLIGNIEDYDGENWLRNFPEDHQYFG